ncbi:MAG: DUF1189 domain-containing protein [Aerococcus urinaeequi]|nr:DUF1189 domain-containing protein [Aerococcus urinaeequi]
MKTDVFPLNYAKNIWSPLKAFKNRFVLTWPMMIVVIIFLNALMVIPVTLNYAEMESFPLEEYYPIAASQLVDDQVLDEIQTVVVNEGQLSIPEPFQVENAYGEVVGGLSLDEIENHISSPNFIAFQENQLIIAEEGLPTATVLYTRDVSFGEMETKEEIVEEISRQWFNQNRVLIVLIFSFLISTFLLFMLLFLVFGSSFLLYLTKKGSLTTIKTYKESVNLILNSLAVPTFLAMLFGLFYFELYIMVTIQSLGMAAYLFWIWYKVQFNDQRLSNLT